jgi:CubicO group peptidase (beta-lactamase class C family)
LTLRDLARFGELVRADGTISGARVVPAGYLTDATAPGPRDPGDAPYGYMWWPVDTAEYGDVHTGAFQASGIFGQHLYIHPAAEVVIAQTAALALPTGAEPYPEEDCFGAIVAALR